VPQRLLVHSNVLNEDRVMWVRMPAASRGKTDRYAALYITDGGSNVNEVGSVIDFLADAKSVPTLTFGLLYCFFVIDHDRRKILRFNVTRDPNALWIMQQLLEAWPYPPAPQVSFIRFVTLGLARM
jgi:hypothetical protein